MRPLSEYSMHDWLRMRPLVHALKTTRYRLVDRAYRRRPPRLGDPDALRSAMRGRKVLITIAYRDPQVLAWQAPLIRHFVPDTLYVIADNSPDEQSALAIARFAGDSGIPYIRLPRNSWNWGSRSHGLALNWVWYNLVCPARPEAAGFIDHDLFPTAPEDPFAALAHQDFFGAVRCAGPRWFLWAGFCMFRVDRVCDKPLDFGQDWFNGLDTGGGNWAVLYRHADRLRQKELALKTAFHAAGIDQNNVTQNNVTLEWCGTWLHEGGTTLQAGKRQVVAQIVAPLLAQVLAHAG
jgi:hypothetical protein